MTDPDTLVYQPKLTGIYYPTHIPEWYIYDCFYADSGELVIIAAAEIKPVPRIWIINNIDNTAGQEFAVDICPHKHTYVYRLSQKDSLGFGLIDAGVENQLINIRIQQENPKKEQIITLRPNRYPSYANQVVMTTLVKLEDNIIRVWIDFHRRLGIHKFVIYDNAGTPESLAGLVRELVDYIHTGQVILINWPYNYRLPISGISGQTTQQNHAIRAFDTADWLGLFDVDEYINIQRPDIILGAIGGEGMRRFLDGIARKTGISHNKIGGVQFKNKFFYNPDNLPYDDGRFLQIPNCADGITHKGHEKCFVIPRNIRVFAVHMITSGRKLIAVHPKLAYFNHYIYLNKPSRGRDLTPWRDDSILTKPAMILR